MLGQSPVNGDNHTKGYIHIFPSQTACIALIAEARSTMFQLPDRTTGSGAVKEQRPGPTITIVVHEIGALPAPVIREIRSLLERRFQVQNTGSYKDRKQCGSWEFAVSYRLTPLPEARDSSEAERRIAAHCELLDGMAVSNGAKAIAIALHDHWSDDLRERFGEPASPQTIKRWRLRRRRAADTAPIVNTSRLNDEDRIVRGLRRHHAIRTNGSGGSITEGYRRALLDIRRVNSGEHHSYGKPDHKIRPFSYETFRRECRDLKRRRPARRRR